jgi:hypothetical protein
MNARKISALSLSAPDQAPWLREGAGNLLAFILVGAELCAGLTRVMLH